MSAGPTEAQARLLYDTTADRQGRKDRECLAHVHPQPARQLVDLGGATFQPEDDSALRAPEPLRSPGRSDLLPSQLSNEVGHRDQRPSPVGEERH